MRSLLKMHCICNQEWDIESISMVQENFRPIIRSGPPPGSGATDVTPETGDGEIAGRTKISTMTSFGAFDGLQLT